jgi:hypothetical protein
MNANNSLKSLCLVAPAIAVGVLLGGCNNEDHSKPDLNDVRTALQERYSECPLWTLSSVRRIDGAPNQNGYEISYSFVLTVKDPNALLGPGANVSKDDAQHLAAAMFGDTSDPCFYGVFPLSPLVVAAHQQQQPLPRSFQGSGDRIFVQSERGWHLDTSPPNPRDPATYDQFSPIDDATAAAMQASAAAENEDASTESDSIFQRLSLLVASLFHRGASPDLQAGAANPSAAIALSASSEPAVASNVTGQAASNAASEVDAASAPTPASSDDASAEVVPASASAQSTTPPTDASTAGPSVDASAALPAGTLPLAQALAPSSAVPATSQPVADPIAASDLEGDWKGTYQCGPYIGQGESADPDAWTRHVTMTVHNGQATLMRQSDGEHGFREVLSGNVLPDLALILTGTGQRIGGAHPWYADFTGRFGGTANKATFEASGTLQDSHRAEFRACRLALSR